ncbi:hypothetical protein [Mycolicibacterium thermoresistibile]
MTTSDVAASARATTDHIEGVAAGLQSRPPNVLTGDAAREDAA